MRTSFLPFSLLYGAATALCNSFYDRGWLRVHRLVGPVVSVGNISVGGAGKTPFVIWLGEQLQQRGIPFDVLSRGYGRQSQGVHLVDPQGSPREFGDEPLLIAKQLGVPVVVGESRYAAGRLAEATFGPQLHLLDDGFQHRALARDFDIVLVSPEDLTGKLLPVGRLREPPSSLRRTDSVVTTSGVSTMPQLPAVRFQLTRSIFFPSIPETSAFVFCGIAKPAQFIEQIESSGIAIAGSKIFRDHHRYSTRDVSELLRLRQAAGVFITTEKDCINLGELREKLSPMIVPRVKMEIADGDALIELILQRTQQAAVR